MGGALAPSLGSLPRARVRSGFDMRPGTGPSRPSDPRSAEARIKGADRDVLVVLFDGHCGLCTRAARWLQARDARQRLVLLPNQQPGVLERYGLTREQVDRELWALETSGDNRFAGAAALSRALLELGGVWPAVGRLSCLAPVRGVEASGYRWFAAHRGWFARWGVTPACEEPGASCSDG